MVTKCPAGNLPRKNPSCGRDCRSARPLVDFEPPCTLREAATQKRNQHKPICKLGQRGLPRKLHVFQWRRWRRTRAGRWMEGADADRGTELTCWEGCPGNKGVCIWQHKYLITRKACAAAAQALLTPWALCLFSHPMMYLLFQDPRSGPSQRVDLRVWSL